MQPLDQVIAEVVAAYGRLRIVAALVVMVCHALTWWASRGSLSAKLCALEGMSTEKLR